MLQRIPVQGEGTERRAAGSFGNCSTPTPPWRMAFAVRNNSITQTMLNHCYVTSCWFKQPSQRHRGVHSHSQLQPASWCRSSVEVAAFRPSGGALLHFYGLIQVIYQRFDRQLLSRPK